MLMAMPASAGDWTSRGAFAAISVPDAAAAAAWYKARLGFVALREGALPNGMAVALLQRGNDLLEIVSPAPATRLAGAAVAPSERFRRDGIFKLGFIVDDLDALAARLEGDGVAFNHGIVRPEGNPYRTFAVTDPDGNTIQFFGR
jgi:catechol 2,3-dioxygenase-like lactoylglutathione lyase family enzyme